MVGRDEIFAAAVTSFFSPPFDAKNLWMALEWIAMEASYNEVRLVTQCFLDAEHSIRSV